MQALSWNILFLRKCAYAAIFAAFFAFAALPATNAATPAKAPAKGGSTPKVVEQVDFLDLSFIDSPRILQVLSSGNF